MIRMMLLPRKLSGGFLLFWVALSAGCKKEVPDEQPPRPVRAMCISDAPALLSRSFPGTAEAVDVVELSFRVGGPLVAFPGNRLGMRITKGDLLAQIDSRDYQVRLRDSQATLAKARSELEAMRKARPEEIEQLKAGVGRAQATSDFARAEHKRNLSLTTTGAISASELEMSAAKAKLGDAEVVQAREALRIGMEGARPEDIKAKEAQIASLQASEQTAQDELTDTKLLAPFDGSVSTVYVENYEVVQPKQRIVRLVNTSELEMRVDIPENLIALVPQVREVFVTIQAASDEAIPARIAEVGTEASPTTRTYPVKLRFQPPAHLNIRPGMTGFARGRGDVQRVVATSAGPSENETAADGASENAAHTDREADQVAHREATHDAAPRVIPATAVFDRDGKRQVWIYDSASKVVHARPVKVLETTPYGLKVTGLKLGEWVITAGVHYLEENQTVRLMSDDGTQPRSAT